MASPQTPLPVKFFVAVLANPAVPADEIRAALVETFGPVDLSAGPWPHTFTDYYRDEMGEGLLRSFFAFRGLIDPAELVGLKLCSGELEAEFAARGLGGVARPVNFDPGYVTDAKVVLASLKDFSHRVYLKDGVYGEVTLHLEGGQWRDRPWTFPDYRTAPYKDFFMQVRTRLREQKAARDV
jgi:hypothetical protein